MSKVTLDIICETAFGYNADSLHNPDNELAHAYEDLLSLQSGISACFSCVGATELIDDLRVQSCQIYTCCFLTWRATVYRIGLRLQIPSLVSQTTFLRYVNPSLLLRNERPVTGAKHWFFQSL